MTQMFDLRSFASQSEGLDSARAAARIGSLTCFGSGLGVWHGNVPRRVLYTLTLGAIAGNVWVCTVAGIGGLVKAIADKPDLLRCIPLDKSKIFKQYEYIL